jgi:hypothetical protein
LGICGWSRRKITAGIDDNRKVLSFKGGQGECATARIVDSKSVFQVVGEQLKWPR